MVARLGLRIKHPQKNQPASKPANDAASRASPQLVILRPTRDKKARESTVAMSAARIAPRPMSNHMPLGGWADDTSSEKKGIDCSFSFCEKQAKVEVDTPMNRASWEYHYLLNPGSFLSMLP